MRWQFPMPIVLVRKSCHQDLLSLTNYFHLAAKLRHKDIFCGPQPQRNGGVAPYGVKESPSGRKSEGSSIPVSPYDSESIKGK